MTASIGHSMYSKDFQSIFEENMVTKGEKWEFANDYFDEDLLTKT